MTVDVNQLGIVLYPDPILRATTRRIESVTLNIRDVAKRMLELMHQAPGVGLAAPQVGLPWRMFVANSTGQPDDDQVFINPTLSQVSKGTTEHEEGCLSLPNVTGIIRRPQTIAIEAMGLDGQSFTLTSDDLPGRIWQHEFDHLEGVLIIDRMDEIDRLVNKKTLRDLEATHPPGI